MANRYELMLKLLNDTNKQLKELEELKIKDLNNEKLKDKKFNAKEYKKLHKQILKSYFSTRKQIDKEHPIEEYIEQLKKEGKQD